MAAAHCHLLGKFRGACRPKGSMHDRVMIHPVASKKGSSSIENKKRLVRSAEPFPRSIIARPHCKSLSLRLSCGRSRAFRTASANKLATLQTTPSLSEANR